MARQAPFYIFTAFVFSYGPSERWKVPRDFVLTAVLTGLGVVVRDNSTVWVRLPSPIGAKKTLA